MRIKIEGTGWHGDKGTRGDVYTESFLGLIPLCDCFEEFKDRF